MCEFYFYCSLVFFNSLWRLIIRNDLIWFYRKFSNCIVVTVAFPQFNQLITLIQLFRHLLFFWCNPKKKIKHKKTWNTSGVWSVLYIWNMMSVNVISERCELSTDFSVSTKLMTLLFNLSTKFSSCRCQFRSMWVCTPRALSAYVSLCTQF